MADWHWEPATDDLLDGLPPAALAAVRQVAEELTVRESMIFLDDRTIGSRQQRFFGPLFRFCYVGRVGLEPTTGGL